MKNTSLTLTALTLISVSAVSQVPKWKLETGTGLYNADFRWSIAGNRVNVLSELKWENLSGYQFDIQLNRLFYKKIELGFVFNHKEINKGKGTDVDYREDNRTDAFSYQKFLSNRGYINNWGFTIKHLGNLTKKITFNPYLGVNFGSQKLYVIDFEQQLESDINSTYSVAEQGILIGAIAGYRINKVLIELNMGSRFYAYEGKGYWNTNPKFAQPLSFTQSANGYGLYGSIKGSGEINKLISVFALVAKQHDKTFSGADEVYLSNGSTQYTRFNGAIGNSIGITMGIATSF